MDFLEKIKDINQEIFQRIFEIRKINLNLENFENFPEFQKQELLFIKDKILGLEAIFNFSRKKRPQPRTETKIENEPDPFCNAHNLTPIDELGRLENESALTAANLSKMADYHSLIIFKKHNFTDLTEKDFEEALNLTQQWFEKIKNLDQAILTQILIWNYHYRAAASILHPHFQVLAYKEVPQRLIDWQKNIENYRNEFRSDYLTDYFQLAQELGLGKRLKNLKVWLSLTPFKEKTIFFEGDLKDFWQILEKLIQNGTQSFNICYIYQAPYFKNFGFFVDRGEVNTRNSDFGTLEIFGLPVVSYNPSQLASLIFS